MVFADGMGQLNCDGMACHELLMEAGELQSM